MHKICTLRLAADEGFDTGFYPFAWGMSGLGYAHGANSANVGSYLNSTLRRAMPKLATLHDDLAAAAQSGGGYTAYWWNNQADEPMHLKISFTVGVRRFDVEYYIGCGFKHASDAIDNPARGPHGRPCELGTNQPCAFTNVLDLAGHVKSLCFMNNIYDPSTAFALATHNETYSNAAPEGFSSACAA